MLRRSVVIASISVTALLLVAGDASAGHRHRKAKNNNAAACCPTTVNTVSHASNCGGGGGGCSGGYPGGYASGYSGGCGQMHSPSVYPYSGQTTVSNGGYSTYGTTNFYPSTGHQGGGCSSCGGTSY